MLISRAYDGFTFEGGKSVEEVRDILAMEIGRIIINEYGIVVPSMHNDCENMIRVDIVVDSLENYMDNHKRVMDNVPFRAFEKEGK